MQEQRKSNRRILLGVAIGLGLLLIVSTFKAAWKFLLSSSGLSTDVLIIGLIASAIVVGTAWAVRAGFFSGPYKFVSWLVLAIVVLVPSFFLVDIQIPKPSKKPRNYSPVQLAESENIAKESEPKSVEQQAKPGAILLDVDSGLHGLTVGLFSDDPIGIVIKKKEGGSDMEMMSGGFGSSRPFGFSQEYSNPGRNTHKLPVGTYDVVVTSQNTGWINGMMPLYGQQSDAESRGSSLGVGTASDESNPQYLHSKIEVQSGKIVTLTIRRDFKKLAENHPDWSDGKFFKFIWPKHGQGNISYPKYLLTLEQAKVVQRLFKAFADDKPEVSETNLLAIANKDLEPGKQYKTLNALFNNGKHPAWNSLIIPGKEKETWQLSDPE